MTIRTKLAIWYGLLTGSVLILSAGLRYAGQQQMLLDQKDYSLRATAGILDASIASIRLSEGRVRSAVDRMLMNHPDIELKGMIIEVYDASGSIVFSSSMIADERLPVTEKMWNRALQEKATFSTILLGKNRIPIRILMKPVYAQNQLRYLIQVGSSMINIQRSLENTLFLSLLFIPAAALLVGMGGGWLTRRALKPLDTIVRTARRIRSGDLSHRIEAMQAGHEIRELAQTFNQMIARLEASFQQIQDFSDNVSHELRIPLAILRGETELSLRHMRTKAAYREVLESNLEEILRMEKIVERLLLLSKAGRGEIPLNVTEVDLGRLIEAFGKRFQATAQKKEIRMGLQGLASVIVKGDAMLLEELLLNLVYNALSFTPAGGEVTISLEKEGNRAKISVADTGCGIPEEEIPRIFDRFYQVDKSRASGGSGLGLSICRWIAKAHEGSIVVESRVGKGSRFTVTLPQKD